jgi:hypothetical protein
MSTTTMTTTLRAIAACYTRAANALEDAALLASTLAPDPDRGEDEPTAMLVDEHAPPGDEAAMHAFVNASYAEIIAALGWDPDGMSARAVSDKVHALASMTDLDSVEVLERRRGDMRPPRKVRDSVLEAITARRDVLAARAREAAL